MAGSQRLFLRPRARVSAPLVSARAVRGELRLRAERDSTGKTVLADRHAAGAFHLSKPYWDGHALMVQWINPTAGIFAGDVLESDVVVGEDASLLLTTPSATRIHTRIHRDTPPGEQRLRFHVTNGGFLDVQSEWLIPQKQSAFQQVTTIDLEPEAGLFFTEFIAPGRVAHGESLQFDELDLRLVVRADGTRVIQDRIFVNTQSKPWKLRSPHGEGLYLATVVIASPFLDRTRVRPLPNGLSTFQGCDAGVTWLKNGLAVTRLTSLSPLCIRAALKWLRFEIGKHCRQLSASLRKL